MDCFKIVIGCVAWTALCLLACVATVGVISRCRKEDNGDYAEPDEGK